MPLYADDPRYPTSSAEEIEIQIFRMYAGDYAVLEETFKLSSYYKNPNKDAIRDWIRASDPKPKAGRYLFVAPETFSGHANEPGRGGPPCATAFEISYPEFMVTRPKSNEPGFREHDVFFADDPYFASVKATSR